MHKYVDLCMYHHNCGLLPLYSYLCYRVNLICRHNHYRLTKVGTSTTISQPGYVGEFPTEFKPQKRLLHSFQTTSVKEA